MVGHPVKGGVGEDRVHHLAELELGEVGDDQLDAIGVSELLAGVGDHRRSRVDPDDAPARDSGDDVTSHPPAAAAGVEHGLVVLELEPAEDVDPPGLLHPGDAVVGLGVPVGGASG